MYIFTFSYVRMELETIHYFLYRLCKAAHPTDQVNTMNRLHQQLYISWSNAAELPFLELLLFYQGAQLS